MVNRSGSETEDFVRHDSNSRPETTILNCVLNAPLMFTSIIGNTLLLAAMLRTPSLRSPSIMFLCSLALSDLLVGLVVQPVYIANELTKIDLLYKIKNATTFAACGVSLLTMAAISVDRFLALHYHMRYPNLMTTRRAIYTSATLWLISFLFSFAIFGYKYIYFLGMAVGIAICLLISTVYYFRIYRIVRQHQLQIHAQQQAVESFNTENNQNVLRSKKSAINTFIYYIAMIVCYTLLFISISILVISRDHWTIEWRLADTVSFMNSSINPFLYCWRQRELRSAVVKTARQISCKQTEDN